MHTDDRITMEPGTPRKGQNVKIEYRGLLANSGADSIWLHRGFDGWNNVQDVPMNPLPHGSFTCDVKFEGSNSMNFCFKDSANHWDNNNGWNWEATVR